MKRTSPLLPRCRETPPGPGASSTWQPRPASALVSMAMALGARPAVRLTLRESDDVEGDVALLRSIADLLRAYPGKDVLVMRIVTLEGESRSFLWRGEASRELRLALAALLRARASGGPRRPER